MPRAYNSRRSQSSKHTHSTVSIAVHRFEELIGGHPYLIEVAAVADDRWRACIVRIPGGPIALMPFYGPTPDEAARRLRQWLIRAHEPASGGGEGRSPHVLNRGAAAIRSSIDRL